MNANTNTEIAPTILVVEDSADDFFATRRVLRSAGINGALIHCTSGEDGIDYLRRRNRYADDPTVVTPDLILLDLNLPGLSGVAVLEEIKNDDQLKSIPAIVLSNSSSPGDVRCSFFAGANSYVRKPMLREKFEEAMQHLKEFWFDVSILPGVQK